MYNYLELIDQYKDQMLKDLQHLISFRSIAGRPEGSSPFGKDVQAVFDAMLAIGERDGFTTKNVDNYGGHIEFKGEGEGIFALAGHLDVVPEGSGWNHDPFGGEIVGDRLYGRGAIDDKGPTIAGYYAIKALRDSGFKPKKDIRLILGLDEETDWDGMNYYMERETAPDMGFAPDADFPVIHCEKGLIDFNLIKPRSSASGSGFHLVSMEGGNASNMVADSAKAVIVGDISKAMSAYNAKGGYTVLCEKNGDVFEVSAKGISAHGAMPEKGLNAITILFSALETIVFDEESINDFIRFYNEKIGFNYHGENFGCCFEDEPSGKLNFNVGVIKIDESEICLTVNARYPATMKEDDIYLGMEPVIKEAGCRVERRDHLAPLYVPKDDPLVKILMDVYQEFTGDTMHQPIVIGGATYARTVPHSVAYGPVFPNEPPVEHQPNEYICISSMVKATKIFAEAIYRLTK